MVDLQILSDLHLEKVEYLGDEWHVPPRAPHLALLGDIGYGKDERLFWYIEAQLRNFKTVFFLLGNHEAYYSNWPTVRDNFQKFSQYISAKASQDPGLGHFVFLDKTRYDISDVTILGCTLHSNIVEDEKPLVASGLNDFRLIEGWTADAHIAAHREDLAWLNSQVAHIARTEPNRRIAILTHHSPSKDPRAVSPRYQHGDPISSGFRTDLSHEDCWKYERIRLWGFGHTHFNVDFNELGGNEWSGVEWRGKRIVANQMGYVQSPARDFNPEKVVTI